MSTLPIQPGLNIVGHAWWPKIDEPNQRHIWNCTCGHSIVQPYGAPVPDELISHPQSFGQMRGEK